MVRASRLTSSPLSGSGTRRCNVPAVMASTSARMASTGCSARPVTNQASTPTTASSTGYPTAREPSSVDTERLTLSSGVPAKTVSEPRGGDTFP